MTKKIVAGIQTDVEIGKTVANLDRMLDWLSRPEIHDADLVVFPECMLSGYCFESREEASQHAQPIPGPATKSIAQYCQKHGRHVVFGMLEATSEGQLFNSCVLVGRHGVVDVYRKIHLPFLGVDRFTDEGQNAYRASSIDDWKIGMHICYDGSFPESSRALALEGAELLLLPTNWPPGADTFAQYLPNARALENHVYFFAVNRVGIERGFRFIGHSRLCDLSGAPISEANHENEAILIGEIDPAKARDKKIVRVPKAHEIDRWADRRPQHYGKLTESPPRNP